MDQKYRDMVDKRLAENSSEIFGNFSREHAGYIIAQFISKAQNSIEIFSGNFADSFYDGISVAPLLEQAAERIQKNGGKIRIITINGVRSESLTQLSERINQKLTAPIVEYRPAKCNNPENVNHYMVVDSMRYRQEEPHPVPTGCEAPEYVKAEVCCNGPQKAARLIQDFNSAWSMLSPGRTNG
ncbi:MAG: hypothetical protein DBX90_14795 [Lentisphaerae bacterium]|nr:MAG: hypothetical protein DBX90_14795 [Lentisphaerota bacterium]